MQIGLRAAETLFNFKLNVTFYLISFWWRKNHDTRQSGKHLRIEALQELLSLVITLMQFILGLDGNGSVISVHPSNIQFQWGQIPCKGWSGFVNRVRCTSDIWYLDSVGWRNGSVALLNNASETVFKYRSNRLPFQVGSIPDCSTICLWRKPELHAPLC